MHSVSMNHMSTKLKLYSLQCLTIINQTVFFLNERSINVKFNYTIFTMEATCLNVGNSV